MKTVAFFNHAGGVGKTTLVYHLAWMLAERGETVLAVDLDPQADLSRLFLSEDQLETLWRDVDDPGTISGALRPTMLGSSDVLTPRVARINSRLGLVVGNLALATFEDSMWAAWQLVGDDSSVLRRLSAVHQAVKQAARTFGATWILIDASSNLGAINRAGLIASDHVLIPLRADLASLQALRALGPSLQSWRTRWQKLRPDDRSYADASGAMELLGYIVTLQKSSRASQRWIDRLFIEYRKSVLNEPVTHFDSGIASDPHCLAILPHYRSLMPMAKEARNPVFALKPADGAIGAHVEAVQMAYSDFKILTDFIARS